MTNVKLEKEEVQILKDYDAGKLRSIKTAEKKDGSYFELADNKAIIKTEDWLTDLLKETHSELALHMKKTGLKTPNNNQIKNARVKSWDKQATARSTRR